MCSAASNRDLSAESVYEYDSRAGIWRLFRLFDEYRLRVTFFGCAVAFERNPEVGRALQEAGHDICGHGWRWIESWPLSREEERQHIQWAIESFRQTCGARPLGWYWRCGPSVNTRELLVEEGGFLYDSDAYNDDLPYFTEVKARRHLVVPYSMTYNDMQGTRSPPTSSTTAGADSTSSRERATRATLAKGNVWFARRIDIARWWLDHDQEFAR